MMRRGTLTLARVSLPAWRSEFVTSFEIPVRGFADPDAVVVAASMRPQATPGK
jgi:hypothetical protein